MYPYATEKEAMTTSLIMVGALQVLTESLPVIHREDIYDAAISGLLSAIAHDICAHTGVTLQEATMVAVERFGRLVAPLRRASIAPVD